VPVPRSSKIAALEVELSFSVAASVLTSKK
jgi:hypothetical protein